MCAPHCLWTTAKARELLETVPPEQRAHLLEDASLAMQAAGEGVTEQVRWCAVLCCG